MKKYKNTILLALLLITGIILAIFLNDNKVWAPPIPSSTKNEDLQSYTSKNGFTFTYPKILFLTEEEGSIILTDQPDVASSTFLVSLGPIWTSDSLEHTILKDTYFDTSDPNYKKSTVTINENTWIAITAKVNNPTNDTSTSYYLSDAPIDPTTNSTGDPSLRSHLQATVTILETESDTKGEETLRQIIDTVRFEQRELE